MKCGVFLDRDNTIIANDGDLGDPEQVRLLPGAALGIRALREAGFLLVVVTNQGGVARGAYAESDVEAVHERTESLLARESQWTRDEPLISKWLCCPFHPEGTLAQYRQEHPWRKPAPGMLLWASQSLDLDLARSWMVGDQERDVEAGRAAGCTTIRIMNTAESQPESRAASGADFVEADLLHATHRILRSDGLDGAAAWVSTSAVRITALVGALGDPRAHAEVRTAAEELATREQVRIVRLVVDESGVELEIVGSEIVAVGFAAELRRTTNDWASRAGIGPLWVST
ncbi:MAG: HAD family hydrolase [Phycisphaerales bacterium]|nr:HAD family hydrolase [Phycisphaerales bacterium]